MAKKPDDFGTIKITQEELRAKMVPKKPTPPPAPPVPPPAARETPAPRPSGPPPGAATPENPAQKPSSGTVPIYKPGAKPGKSVLERKAAEVCKEAPLSDDAKPLMTAEVTVQALVPALMEKELPADAVMVLAFTLPKREAVGWGLHCVKQIYGPTPLKPVQAVFQSVQQWLADLSEAHRRSAHDAAEAADSSTPAGCLGMAVFFSGGSIAPPTAPAVAPQPNLTHQMVAAALYLAAVFAEPEKASEKFASFIADGLKLASLVPEAPPGPPAPKPGPA